MLKLHDRGQISHDNRAPSPLRHAQKEGSFNGMLVSAWAWIHSLQPLAQLGMFVMV